MTALNEHSVDEGANMMASLLLTNPNVPVLVYDLGLPVREAPRLLTPVSCALTRVDKRWPESSQRSQRPALPVRMSPK